MKDEPLRVRLKGAFGRQIAHHDVIECNARASLHVHGQSHGGAMPYLMADCASDDELRPLITKAIDSMIRRELPLEYHLAARARKVLRVAKRRDGAFGVQAPSDELLEGLTQEGLAAMSEEDRMELRERLEAQWLPELLHDVHETVANRHIHDYRAAPRHYRVDRRPTPTWTPSPGPGP